MGATRRRRRQAAHQCTLCATYRSPHVRAAFALVYILLNKGLAGTSSQAQWPMAQRPDLIQYPATVDLSEMDYDQLASFLEVSKLRSFSRAAEKLYRTQPAISAQVRLLEQECGEKLFDRSGKKVQLTPAGEILQGYAERLLAMQKEALQAIAELNQTPRGKLHIGTNEATCLYVLPKTFFRFKQLYPLVQISIYRNFSHKILQKVQEGAVDLGIVSLPTTATNMEVIPVFRDEVQVVVPKTHPLAKNKSVTVEELAQHPLILPKTGHTRVVIDRLLRPQRDRLQISMELASVETIKKFVGAGLGISLISRTYVQT